MHEQNDRHLLLVSDADEIVSPSVLLRVTHDRHAYYNLLNEGGMGCIHCSLETRMYRLELKVPLAGGWLSAFFVTDRLSRALSQQSHRGHLATLDALRGYFSGVPATAPGGNLPRSILVDAGWHLTYFMSPAQIQRKLVSFGHREYSRPPYTDMDHIKRAIALGRDLFDRPPAFEVVGVPAEVQGALDLVRLQRLLDGVESELDTPEDG